MIMGTESPRGTGADEPVERPGAPGEGDPTLERDLPDVEQPTQAFQEPPSEAQPAAEPPAAAGPPATGEQRTQAFEPPPPEARPATEPPAAAEPAASELPAAGEAPVDRNRQTEEFAPLPVAAPWTAQAPPPAQAPPTGSGAPPSAGYGAPPPAGGPPRRRPGTGVLIGAAAALVVLGAVVALALTSLTGDDPATTSATAVAPTTAAPSTAPSQTTAAPTTTQAASVGGTVQVVRSGFTQLPPQPDGDVDVSYAVVLRNPRNDQVALNVRTIVTFTAANGAVLDVKDEGLDALLPGQTAAVADTTGVRGARRMRVQVVVGSFAPAQGLTGNLSASGVRTAVVAGELTTTATVRSSLTQPLNGADVTAVYYNGSGRIIGGQSDSVDVVPAGGAVPVRMDSSTILRGIAKTEVHANPKDFVPGP
jgi:hypothetical protein